MGLSPGTRLGAYEIVALIGSGGMGEVYRARDTKLGREVALKILPASFTNDPERVARFRREAQVLASLNHPHIAQIYGLEESSGTQFLVLELVDGESLNERIARAPIPVDEALGIARQIAEALEAAHERGIIHRDLKPANVALTKDGAVKVLDFGLAKAFDPAASSGAGATMSPTLSLHATQAGVILGTAAYMAPEQARGKAADKRADVWAFGCVLYEMLTRRRAFDGDDISTTLAAVLKTDPDWSALPPATPPSVRRLLGRCFVKDPKDRLRDIGEARIAIDRVASGTAEESVPSVIGGRAPLWRRLVIPGATGLAMSLVAAGLVRFAIRSTLVPPRVSRLEITTPNTAGLAVSGNTLDFAITPDGSRLAYVSADRTTLFVRPLDQLEATPLVRGIALRGPFFSPDGQWLGFFEGPSTLKRVAITGGPAVLVTQFNGAERGATWASDGTIIFATSLPETGLQRVSADGGVPVVLTRPDQARGQAWPEALPGGQAVLYTVGSTADGREAASIAVFDLRTGQSKVLLRGGSHAQYAPSGHLVYGAAGTLRAVGFDLRRLIVVGSAVPVVPQVLTTASGGAEAVLARDGTLVYLTGVAGSAGRGRTLVWVDREGRETPIAAAPHLYVSPRVSPDGTRIAVDAVDQDRDIWIWDLARAALTRLTFDPALDRSPLWTPDGHRVVFGSSRAGRENLFWQAADGTGTVERLTESPERQFPSAITPDGTRVVVTQESPKTFNDVVAVSVDGSHQVLPLVQTPFDERNGIVSPDGRWLAYEANDSGQYEIHVRPFPAVNSGHWQVSISGGTQPLWARSGRELFYLAGDGTLMRVAVASGLTWAPGTPTKMFEGRHYAGAINAPFRSYDITADGQRFLMIKSDESESSPPQIVVVQHFDEELKRLVPVK